MKLKRSIISIIFCFALLFSQLTVVTASEVEVKDGMEYYDAESGIHYRFQNFRTEQTENNPLGIGALLQGVDEGVVDMFVPDTVKGVPVVAFYGFSFLPGSDVESIRLPDSFKHIYLSDFAGSKVKSLHIPAGVEIFSATNLNDTEILSVTLDAANPYYKAVGDSIYSADGKTLYMASTKRDSRGTFTVPSDVEIIDTSAFAGTGYSRVVLPAGLREIKGSAFANMTDLTEINIPSGIKSIGYRAFAFTHSLKSIALPEGLTEIGEQAFASSGLDNIYIPSTVTTLERGALWGLYNVKEIVIPKGITEIPYACFHDCISLERIYIPDTVVEFSENTSLISMGYGAFEGCDNLEAVFFFGDAPQKIDESAFSRMSEEVTFYYLSGKSGWTYPTWNGIKTSIFTDNGIYSGNGVIAPTPTIPESPVIPQTPTSFSDVPSTHWAYGVVGQAIEYNLVKGMGDGTFNPSGKITRAEAVTFAARLLSTLENADEIPVSGDGKWFDVYIEYMKDFNVISVYKAEWVRESPNTPVTREEFVDILSSLFMLFVSDEELNQVPNGSIPDLDEMEKPFYSEYIYRFYRAGILSGMDSNMAFKPRNNLTRAEACAIVMRLILPENRVKF